MGHSEATTAREFVPRCSGVMGLRQMPVDIEGAHVDSRVPRPTICKLGHKRRHQILPQLHEVHSQSGEKLHEWSKSRLVYPGPN